MADVNEYFLRQRANRTTAHLQVQFGIVSQIRQKYFLEIIAGKFFCRSVVNSTIALFFSISHSIKDSAWGDHHACFRIRSDRSTRVSPDHISDRTNFCRPFLSESSSSRSTDHSIVSNTRLHRDSKALRRRKERNQIATVVELGALFSKIDGLSRDDSFGSRRVRR